MQEQITVCANPAYPLDGLLTLPDSAAAKVPAVVLVHGSGAQDKDETIEANKPFADLATGLAARGIASLRYDKRSFTYGQQMVDELGGRLSVEEEVIEDALAATRLLKADSRVDANRVFIIGHSLGGMLAPRIDAEGGAFAGMVILAGTMRTLDEVIMDQNADALSQMPAEQREAIMPQVQALQALFDSIAGMTEEEAQQAMIMPQNNIYAWYLKEMHLHPVDEYLKQADKPVLVMQGDKDVQVSVEKDFRQYQEVLRDNPRAVCRLYPGLNHLFMPSIYGTISQVMEEYKILQLVDSTVVENIAQWILAV